MGDVQTTLRLNDQASSVLKKVAENAQQAAKSMEQTGKSIDKAFQTNAPTQFSSKAGNAFSQVESKAESLGNKIDEVFEARESTNFGSKMESGFKTAENGANSFKSSATSAGQAVDALGDKAEELGESVSEAGAGADGVAKVGEEARGAGSGFSEANGQAVNLMNTIKQIAVTIGALALANKVKDFVTDSINLGRDYTAEMSEVAAISGATGDDYKMLQDTARQYGATTVFSASEAAEALKYMSLAGWDAQQSSSALGGVLNLAAASGMELGQASDMVTDYLSAFGMQANQSAYFADMLSYAQSNSNTTAEQLGEAYLNSAAMLHSAGQDVETTTSFLEAMANQGTKGSRAGTQLAAITRDITQKMTTYADKAQIAKAAEDGFVSSTGNMNDLLGRSAIAIGNTLIPVNDAKGNFRDLTDVMTDVQKATEGMGSAQKAAALSTTFTSDSTRGVNQLLTEGMDKVAGYEDALRHSSGAAEKAADTMNDNLKGDQANLNSAFEEMQLQVFEGLEGSLRKGTQYLTNSIIPILTDWVPKAASKVAEGVEKVGQVLSPLFETILKNPGGVAKVMGTIGTGLAAFQGFTRIGQIADIVKDGSKTLSGDAGGFIGGIAKIGTTLAAHPWAALGAAAAAGITAVVLAVKQWNDTQIDESLSEKMGNVQLSEEQASEFASRVLNLKWKVNIDAALDHFTNADELAQQASEALSQNNTIEWKARLGFKLSDDDISSYEQNIQTYIDNIQQSLSEQTLALSLAVSDVDIKFNGDIHLNDLIQSYATQDIADASALSQKLTETVQAALEDGIIDVDEQAAIDLLQQKINNIMSNWDQGEAQAKLDVLEQEYGRMSGKDLTKDSFTEVVKKLGEQRQEASEALEKSNESALAGINAMHNAGRLSDSNYESAKNQIAEWAKNQEADSLVKSLQFETNTLADTYGDKLQQNQQKIEQSTDKFFKTTRDYLKNQDYQDLMNSLDYGFAQAQVGTNLFSDKDQKALNDLWKVMQPDASAMTDLLDTYRKTGQEVPKAVMDGYNEAMQIGAAVGDVDASWAVFAQQMVADPANKALIDAIDKGTVQAPQELKDALDRAMLKVTDEPLTLDEIQANIQDVSIDDEKLQSMLQQKIEGLSQGTAQEVDGGKIAVNFDVETAMTAEDLASKLGMEVDQLLQNNPGLTRDTELQVGTKITIDSNGVTVDTSGVGAAVDQAAQQAADAAGTPEVNTTAKENVTLEAGNVTDNSNAQAAAQQAADSAGTQEVNTTATANTTLQAGNVDTSQVSASIENALNGDQSANVTMPANVTLTAGSVDASQVGTAVQSAVDSQFANAITGNGTVNAQLTKGTDNVAEVYNQVGSAVRSAFSQAYSASARVNVTITANYSLANPSKTITFGGGGSGSATVTASLHAMGGYFDQAHLGVVAEDGPEYIIPMDGSDRSRDMLSDAASMLGVSDVPTVTPTQALNNGAQGVTQATQGISKDINLNINGSGNMKINSNMSKADVVNILIENVKDVLMNIVQQEIMDEGEGSYEY